MSEEKLLTIREVSLFLDISEKEVIDLAESQILPAYKIGGVYLRFKRYQVEEFKKNSKPHAQKSSALLKASFGEKVGDFFYFNDFYILSALIIAAILVIIFRGF
ncbi:MAG: helix-turn-helix domain-containing protein [Candidatus Omnitrophota bacterium]